MPEKNRFPAVLVPPAPAPIPIQDGRGLDKGQNGLGIGGEGDPSYTLDTMGAASVAAPAPFVKAKRAQSVDDDETWEADRPAPTLSVFDSGDSRATVAIVTPAPAYAVRRLTPTECERLQGFPDGWTAIPFRGKPASDGPRYKAIGNSMAVPVMKWIGERIAIVDKATKGEG
jgi:DNA (cytosine-5)-methyltransferase 1